MEIVSIFDLITLVANICIFIILLKFWSKSLLFYSKIIFTFLISLNLFHSISNFLEWSGITNFFDPYEDYVQILKPLLWFTLFFVLMQEISESKIKSSEKKYREAYNQAEFYKDIYSHDINNILQNVCSANELIKVYIKDAERLSEMDELMEIIDSQVKRGTRLVLNIRKLSKLNDSPVEAHLVNLTEVLHKSIDYIKASYANKDLSIKIESVLKETQIQANELLEDIFINILINAVTYNKSLQIEILIKISKFQEDTKNYIKIEFIDNGFGIQDNRKEIIFKRGIKTVSSSKGMGLGLSLVKKIIDNYRGKIWVEDKVSGDYTKGSNFIILFPEVS